MYCQLERQKKFFLPFSERIQRISIAVSTTPLICWTKKPCRQHFRQHFCTRIRFSPERDEGQEDREEERRDRKIKVDGSNLLLYDFMSQQGVTTGSNVVHFCFSRSAMECAGVEYAHHIFGTFHGCTVAVYVICPPGKHSFLPFWYSDRYDLNKSPQKCSSFIPVAHLLAMIF